MRATLGNAMLTVALALPQLPALATLPVQMSLKDRIAHADHILIGRVNGVDMVDDGGKMIVDPKALTGPCQDKVIRLRVEVDEVLVTDAKRVPKVLFIPLDRFMHFSLGQVQDAHRGDRAQRLVILKGPAFRPIASGVHFAALAEKDQALQLYKSRPPGAARMPVADESEQSHAERLRSPFCAGVNS